MISDGVRVLFGSRPNLSIPNSQLPTPNTFLFPLQDFALTQREESKPIDETEKTKRTKKGKLDRRKKHTFIVIFVFVLRLFWC